MPNLARVSAVAALLLTLCLAACGDSAPSEAEANQRTAQSVADSLLRADSVAMARDSLSQ